MCRRDELLPLLALHAVLAVVLLEACLSAILLLLELVLLEPLAPLERLVRD